MIADRFPLVVQYDVGDIGVLRFLLAPKLSDDEDAYTDDEVGDGVEDGDKMSDVSPVEDIITEEQKAIEQSQALLAKVNPELGW